MTPKEQQFLFDMIERVSEEIYKVGYEDGKGEKPLKTSGFSISKANRQIILTNLKKHTERR